MMRIASLVLIPGLMVSALAATIPAVSAAEPKVVALTSSEAPSTLDPSLANEVRAAINRGVDWLVSQQRADGSWSNPKFPALTALAVQSLVLSKRDDARAAVDRGVAFIKTCVQTNGGIYVEVQGVKGGGLANYNTAICMTALHAVGDPSLTRIVQNARRFVAGAQHFGEDEYRGGFGYDSQTKRAYTDLLNTYYAVVAMRETASVEDLRPAGEKRVDIDWTETVRFVSRMQNPPAAGTNDAGGFVYNPTDPKAGAVTNTAGVVVFRSYGSITYAGLLALVYANVSPDDVRVRSAYDWASRHWSLEENPGMGQQGLYFFYNVLTKALAVYGKPTVSASGDRQIAWRKDVAAKIVSLQQVDKDGRGFWLNPNGRYWESDTVLVTAYSLISLERL
jgi:squalene-hopene/tetraprenyl-beta-curcumene cyclase